MVCQAIFDGLKVLGPFLSSEYRPSYPVALYTSKLTIYLHLNIGSPCGPGTCLGLMSTGWNNWDH